MMHKYNIKGTPEVYTIAINCCSQKGDLDQALKIYGDMKNKHVLPDEVRAFSVSRREVGLKVF